MGCEQSRFLLHGADHQVVSRSQKRKRIIRDAVKCRKEFAAAHAAYLRILVNVGEALGRFSDGAVDAATAAASDSNIDLPPTSSENSAANQAPAVSSQLPKSDVDVGPIDASKPRAVDPGSTAEQSGKSEQHLPSSTPINSSNAIHLMSPLRSESKPDPSATIFFPPPSKQMSASSNLANVYNSSFPNSPFRYPSRVADFTASSYYDDDLGGSAAAASVSASPQSSAWDPFNLFHSPMPSRTQEQLLKEIQRWEWEQYQVERAKEEGMPDLEELEFRISTSPSKENSKLAQLQKEDHESKIVGKVAEDADDHQKPDPAAAQSVRDATTDGAGQSYAIDEDAADKEAKLSTADSPGPADLDLSLPKSDEVVVVDEDARKQVSSRSAGDSKRWTLKEVMAKVNDAFGTASESGAGVSEMLEVQQVHSAKSAHQRQPAASSTNLSYLRSESFRLTETIKKRFGRKDRSAASAVGDWESFAVDNVADSEMDEIGRSHSWTLETLYAWEKKLYKEVKVWDHLRVASARKSRQLSMMQSERRDDDFVLAILRQEVDELKSQFSVAFDAISSTSANIEQITNQRLYPQLEDLLQRLTNMWKMMMEIHSAQTAMAAAQLQNPENKGTTTAFIATESHRNATIHLERQIGKWNHHLTLWLKTQQKYVDSLASWIKMCHIAEPEIAVKLGSVSPMSRTGTPKSTPIYGLARNWQLSIATIARSSLAQTSEAMTRFADALHSLQLDEADDLHRQMLLGGTANHHRLENPTIGEGADSPLILQQPQHDPVLPILREFLPNVLKSLTAFSSCASAEYEKLSKNAASAAAHGGD